MQSPAALSQNVDSVVQSESCLHRMGNRVGSPVTTGGGGTGLEEPDALGVGGAPPSLGRLEGPGFAGRARPEGAAVAAPGSGAALDVSVGSASAVDGVAALLPFGSEAAASGGSSVVRAKKTPTITAAKPSIATMPIATPMTTPFPPLVDALAAGVGTGYPPDESCPGGNVP